MPPLQRDLTNGNVGEQGLGGGVWGYWTVDSQEPACLTNWGEFVDKGCDDQGKGLVTRVSML